MNNDIRIGDIVKITHGVPDTLGYTNSIKRVSHDITTDPVEIPLFKLQNLGSEYTVTLIKQAQARGCYGLLRLDDNHWEPAVLKDDNSALIPHSNITVHPNDPTMESFVETCPYVPQALIEEADEWVIDSHRERTPSRPADDILRDIAKAAREYEGNC